MSFLGIAGVLAGAAITIINLFSDDHDPVLESLNGMHKKVDALLSGINLIRQTEAEILRQIGRTYEALLTNRALIIQVQDKLDKIAADSNVSALATLTSNFENQVVTLLGGLISANSPSTIQTDNVLRTNYNQYLRGCWSYATATARNFDFALNSVSPVSDSDVAEAVRTRRRIDNLVGLLPTVGTKLQLDLTHFQSDDRRSLGPVCPTAWARAVNVFLEGRVWGVTIDYPDERAQLKDFWDKGQYIRQLINEMTSLPAITKAGENFCSSAGIPSDGLGRFQQEDLKGAPLGLMGLIHTSVPSDDNAPVDQKIVIRGDVILHALPGTSIQPSEPQDGRYILQIHQSPPGNFLGTVVDCFPDYFHTLLDSKFITKIPLPPDPPGSLPLFSARIEAPNTPFHGIQPFDAILEVKNRYAPHPPAVQTGSPAVPLAVHKLQTEASFYAHALIARPKVISNTIANLQTLLPRLETEALFRDSTKDFAYWGEVLRLQSIFLNWRTQTIDRPLDLSVRNAANLPFSAAELFNAIGQVIPKQLPYYGNWKFEVTKIAAELVQTTVQQLRAHAAALAEDKGVAIVDQTLRKLAEYIISRGYKEL
jgi:hypothetical protein